VRKKEEITEFFLDILGYRVLVFCFQGVIELCFSV
jgi:hypothetical protein